MNKSTGVPAGEPASPDGSYPLAPPGVVAVAATHTPASDELANPYDWTFWNCYIANMAMTAGVSILFRYADFVRYLHGSEMDLGLIVGVGMIGALVMRVFQGIGIDRFGARRVWLLSLILFVISVLGHVFITRIDTPTVYLLRMLLTIGTAGAFGASITFVSLRSPETRLAEMIGVLGSSGFMGMALGPTLGDWLFATERITRDRIDRMFYLAAIAAAISFILVAIATRHAPQREIRRQPPLFWLLKRYHPGSLLLVSFAMGLGLGLPNIFLQPYAAELHIAGIKTFFWIYAGAAFAVRLTTRQWADNVGVRPVALTGLALLSISMLFYLMVDSEWSLAWPAALSGIAHALLFPAVMSGGSIAFPSRYRGLATTVMLALFDFGSVIGQPSIGIIVESSRKMGWPPYEVMFVTVAIFLAAVALIYFLLTRLSPSRAPSRSEEPSGGVPSMETVKNPRKPGQPASIA